MDVSRPTEAFLSTIDIHDLLPQREPFVAVGRLTHFDMATVVTETAVNEVGFFVEDGRMTAEGLVENVAQTCAARIGYVNKYILKKGIRVGFIGAVRNMEILGTACVGDLLTTRVEILEEVFGMSLARARVETASGTILTTEMKIAEGDEADALAPQSKNGVRKE